MAPMLEVDGAAAQFEGAVAGDTPLQSTHPVHDKHHLRVLPPSANWYCSKICDWGHSDAFGLLFAYGAKSNVFIYQVTSNDEQLNADDSVKNSGSGVKVWFFAQLVRGKRDRRVTAVQFVTDSTGELRLVCGGEEGSVQIWDVAALTMIEQHRKHKAEVTAVAVSGILDANVVVAGDRQGRISVWERDTGKVVILMPISGDGIHSMALSPQDKALVAVGYRSGVLCLVDVAQGSVRHRLDGHDQEVQCVAWKPATSGDFDEGGGEDTSESDHTDRTMWLASSSRDKTIKVWKVTPNAAVKPPLDQVLRLPTSKQGMSFSQTKQLWLPVAWNRSGDAAQESPGKHSLWSGSFDGSLFLWEWSVVKDVGPAKKAKGNRRISCKPVVVKGGHNRMLFNIVMTPFRSSALVENGAVSMLTVSLDRELRLWKTSPNSKPSGTAVATCIEKMAGLGGHAYSVSVNTATSVVAAGIGDQTVRLWQLNAHTGDTTSVTSDYECDLLWKGLQSKVTCVRWHPLQHSILAYGTEDGRIGFYDIQSKKYTNFRTSHDHEVQQLEWRVVYPTKGSGDCTGDGNSSFLESIKQLEAAQEQGQNLEEVLLAQEGQTKTHDGGDLKVLLWSCDASGQILESNSDTADHNSKKVMIDCVACSWDDQCQLVAIGRSNGSVEILAWEGRQEDNGAVVHRFHEHLEVVTCVAWSKDVGTGLLASGDQDGKIFVYSCGTTATTLANGDTLPGVTQEKRVLGGLAGHSSKITCLKWCSDTIKELVASSSVDGTVQVWNTKSMQREAHFGYHVGRVLSVDWVSPYTLITGGEDQTLRLWDYRTQQKEALVKQNKHIKVKQPQLVEQNTSSHIADGESAHNDRGKAENVATLSEAFSTKNNESKPSTKSKSKKKKALIFHGETELTTAELASALAETVQVNGRETGSTGGNLLVSRDRTALQDFLADETTGFRNEGEWESLANVLLLQGNISEALRIIAKEGTLTATWLAYAPMAGMDVWREMTNLYAHQLDAQGDKKAAAFHFLSIAKVRSAVNCLASGDAYKEALALVRSRLSPHDPLLDEVLWKYADFLSKRGRHGESALALLNIGSIKAKAQAVRALVSTGDMHSVKAALNVLTVAIEPQTTAVHDRGGDAEHVDAELSFPASFFISIIGRAVTKSNFDVAETTGRLLLSRLGVAPSSKPPTAYRLTHCLLGILKALDDCRLDQKNYDEHIEDMAMGRVDRLLQADTPNSVRDFFSLLISPRKGEADEKSYYLYNSSRFLTRGHAAVGHQEKWLSKQTLADRADQFWSQVLIICRCSGYWFDPEGEAHVQEAQDLLVETGCFDDIEKAVTIASNGEPVGSCITTLKTAQYLLRFVMEIMSASFVGALEHMRELLLLLQPDGFNGGDSMCLPSSDPAVASQRSPNDLCIDVMTLLCPCGFVSLRELPQCGELADEQIDTIVLWSSVLLAQCSIVLATAMLVTNNTSTEQNTQLLDALLCLLRTSFLEDDASSPLSPGLMDAGNQVQLEALLNDVLVAAYQLPDGPIDDPTNEESMGIGKANDHYNNACHSRKKILIDGASNVRSRLTWSSGGVKQ